VENEESLKTGAVVGNMANLVENLVNQLLSNSVVTTSVVVRGILLASNHLLRVEQAAVGTSADLIHNIGLKIAVDGTRNIFALTCDTKGVSYITCGIDSRLYLPVSEKKVLKP
jgi:hypothetical protein